MSTFLCLQNTYTHVECGLFIQHDLLGTAIISKHDASSLLVPELDALLKKHNLTITDLDCIGVNQGPGPFTTLRTVITTANGIAFAANVRLIGLDGLRALLTEHAAPTGTTVALFNAFGKEVYFGISVDGTVTQTGYKKVVELLQELHASTDKKITLIGSGVQTYQKEIAEMLSDKAHIAEPLPLAASLQQLGALTYDRLQKKEQPAVAPRAMAGRLSEQLFPLYLKTQMFDLLKN